MYTKQEASKQKQAFWTAFGQYMQPVLSAEGSKVNWVNYKTGVPGIYFKMDADNKHAEINIVIAPNDKEIQARHYQTLEQLKAMLHGVLGEQWQWEKEHEDEYGKAQSRVGKTIDGVNINRTEDWPALISFFKTRIMALDEFWSSARYAFE